jgi:hypothetical protein
LALIVPPEILPLITQVVLGRIGVQRNLRALKDLQKFVL